MNSEMPCEACTTPGQSHASEKEGHKEVLIILDRKKAIQKALFRCARFREAGQECAVIITGKGAEPWMMTREGRVPWDDRKIVRDFLSGK